MNSIFRSIKFNVILFLVIAFLAAMGTFIPQISDNAEKVAALMANRPLWGGLLNAWGFFDIYHTFLFAGLLGLMAFDVVVCKLWNKPPDPGLLPLPDQSSDEGHLTLQALRKKPYRLEGVVSGSAEAISQNLLHRFKREGFRARTIPLSSGGVAVLASRHRLQRWGSYVSHISLVVILLGAMIKSLLGFETFLPILEGRSAQVAEPLYAEVKDAESHWTGKLKNKFLRHSIDPIAHWELTVEKLTVDFYKDSTTPSTFASKVHLYNYDQPISDTVIRVNQPLDVHHVRFYQASWGVTGMVRGANLEVAGKTLHLGMKESFPIPGQPWTGKVEHYLPDFTIGPDGQPSTASLEWKRPALVIGFYNKKDIHIGTLAIGAPSPVTDPKEEPWGVFFFSGGHLMVRPPFHVLSVDPVLFSGIQVSYDPGFPVIVVGVLSMLAGLIVLFYLHQRRVMVFIRPGKSEGESEVEVGGWSSRGVTEFEKEFMTIFSSLKLSRVKGAA